MNAKELLQALDVLLQDERLALRKLDASRALELAEEKQRIMSALDVARDSFTATDVEQLQTLQGALRENLFLLLHARDCVSGVVDTLRDAHGTQGLRVSVRG